ncbi:MAG: orotate phosphoribosyltransferase [Alphaproteobacteria bacterium]
MPETLQNTATASAVARALLEIGAVGVRADNPITFKSGIVSPVYVDNRRLPYHPAQWRVIIEGFKSYIEEQRQAFDVVAGVAVGGVPHASALGYVLQCPSVFIRPQAKEHGTGKHVEGGEVAGKRVLLVEDLISTGGSSLTALKHLRAEGAIADTMLAIVTYDFAEARANFEAAGVIVRSLTTFPAILAEAIKMGRITPDEKATVEDWFADPHGWASRR